MADKQIVDARGLSCPQPVLMTKKALEASPSAKCFEIIVDNGTAKKTSPVLRRMQASPSAFPKTVTIST